MCIALPGTVLAVDGARALVETAGISRWCNALFQPGLERGTLVLVHGGVIVAALSPEEAAEIEAAFTGPDRAAGDQAHGRGREKQGGAGRLVSVSWGVSVAGASVCGCQAEFCTQFKVKMAAAVSALPSLGMGAPHGRLCAYRQRRQPGRRWRRSWRKRNRLSIPAEKQCSRTC